jgi:hypothetical protein
MLVAQKQLELVRKILAEFDHPTQSMRSVALLRAQQVAIITGLRAVGHILQKVDADTAAKKDWLKKCWPQWKQEEIFSEFIELERNRLLKEFQGLLDLKDPAIKSLAVAADPSMPDGVSNLADFVAADLRTGQGDPVVGQMNESVAFWSSRLLKAEEAFAKLG